MKKIELHSNSNLMIERGRTSTSRLRTPSKCADQDTTALQSLGAQQLRDERERMKNEMVGKVVGKMVGTVMMERWYA